ncbi:MAG: formyltetrahydrofolate deformylase [Planctomycetota bacterium]|nr:formyltetrahydrofolate deformylase [Planctomycetota bacterium]MDA1138610.1 formyltetrahydrofolate deformylase [Planctomycetota bacterium]
MNCIVFLIQCTDQKGLVSRISTFFYERGMNIIHCQQHTDVRKNLYFMRMELDLATLESSRRSLEDEFQKFAVGLDLKWSVHYSDNTQRVAILVSKTSHCLYDLLLRYQEREFKCEFPVIISNHPDLEHVADKFRIPFHCLPVKKAAKAVQEQELQELLDRYHIDLIVLARYMQILTAGIVEEYSERIINIHHAFLPAFQGANPYLKAYEKGVKMIGATAHYATADLDEGPIIGQDVERVSHEDSIEDLKQIGRDIERMVLARAVKAHLENRIIVDGNRTIVFS